MSEAFHVEGLIPGGYISFHKYFITIVSDQGFKSQSFQLCPFKLFSHLQMLL